MMTGYFVDGAKNVVVFYETLFPLTIGALYVQQGLTIHYFWVQKKGMLSMYLGYLKIYFDLMSSPIPICAALPIRRYLKEF